MKTISATEFKRNFGKYSLLAQHEEIVVVNKGKIMFRTVPPRAQALKEFQALLNSLPADATIGVEPTERD